MQPSRETYVMRLVLSCLALFMLAFAGPAVAAAELAACQMQDSADCCNGGRDCVLPSAGCTPGCAVKLLPARFQSPVVKPLPISILPPAAVHRDGIAGRPPLPPPRIS